MNKVLCSVLVAGVLAAAPAGAREPFDKDHFAPEGETEVAVWELSREMHRENLKRKAVQVAKTDVDLYLQRVMDRLYPEYPGKFTVRLMLDAGNNAFALPSGVIYVGGGMLLRLTSEAQLAGLLAHEGSHVTHRHGVETLETNQVMTGAVSVLNTLVQLVPVPAASLVDVLVTPVVKGLAQYGIGLTMSSSIFGFTRLRESEADTEGFARMVRAGYHPAEASVMFKELAREALLADVSSPFFFASHPAMEARVENFERLRVESKVETGFVGKDEFEAVIGPHRKSYVEHEFKRLNGHGPNNRTLVAYFSRPDIEKLLAPADAAYFKGEALLRMGKLEETEEAVKSYRKAVANGMPVGRVIEQIILIQLRKQDGQAAIAALEEWAASGKETADLDYQNYLVQAQRFTKKND